MIWSGLCALLLFGTYTVLHNGQFLRYLDEHPDPRWVPAVEYYTGNTFYLFSHLTQATAYYTRIMERYPDSPHAEEAAWNRLQILDDTPGVGRTIIIDAYTDYTTRFPEGAHIERAKDKISAYASGAR